MTVLYNTAGQPLCSRDTARNKQCSQPVKTAGEACFAHRNLPLGTAEAADLLEQDDMGAGIGGPEGLSAENTILAMSDSKWNAGLEPQEEALAATVVAGQPSILWGLPGTGKTSILYSIADSMGLPMQPEGGSVVINAAQRDPTDFIGLPFVVDYEPPVGVDPEKVGYSQATEEVPPKWALELNAKGGVLFIDEINTAPPSVQKALLSIVQERRIGSMHLGDNVHVVMAANPPDSMNGNIPLDPAMANRLCHLEWEPSLRRFTTALLSGSFPKVSPPDPRQDPDALSGAKQNERAILAAFLESKGAGALVKMPDKDSEAERGWPSPRSWMGLSNTLASATVIGASSTAKDRIIKGMVGEGIGREFQTYRRNMNLPRPQDIISGKFPISKLTGVGDGDKLMASAMALIGYVSDGISDKSVSMQEKQHRFSRYLDVMGEVADAKKGDVAAHSIRRIFKMLNSEENRSFYSYVISQSDALKKLSSVLKKSGLSIDDINRDN